MILLVLVAVISLIPFVALFLWLRNRLREEKAYKNLCNKALLRGVLCIFPVMLFSAVTYVLLRLTRVQESNPLLYEALYTFIVLALSEETAKFLMFRRTLRKTDYSFSWLDVTALMTIVGIGFGLIESVVYAVVSSVPVILVRGLCVPHAGYGFLVGYFYGKSLKSGRPGVKWIGFIVAWLLHGMYDFSLSQEFLAINDNLAIAALLLAVAEVVLVIVLIRFAVKARKQSVYLEPLAMDR